MKKNTYKKYCPNVFVAQCTEEHEKGSLVILTTKYGQEHENEIHNYLGKTQNGYFLYSITRVDGFNHQERAKKKAEKLKGYASNAEQRSTKHYKDSQEGRDFLSLGEPIKIGHHSERRHRKLIERNWNRMGKSVAESEKAEEYKRRAKYWEGKTKDINLSMPDSLEFFEFKLNEAKKHHKYLKDNPEKRAHSYSLTYANKEVKELTKKVLLAVRLWGSEEDINQMNLEKEQEAKKKLSKKSKFDDLLNKYGGFFFFGSDVNSFREKHANLITNGYIEKGEKVTHITAGLYVPIKFKDEFINQL